MASKHKSLLTAQLEDIQKALNGATQTALGHINLFLDRVEQAKDDVHSAVDQLAESLANGVTSTQSTRHYMAVPVSSSPSVSIDYKNSTKLAKQVKDSITLNPNSKEINKNHYIVVRTAIKMNQASFSTRDLYKYCSKVGIRFKNGMDTAGHYIQYFLDAGWATRVDNPTYDRACVHISLRPEFIQAFNAITAGQ